MLSYMMQHFNLKSSSYCAFDALSATASTLGHGRTRTLSQSHHGILQVEICLWGRSIFKDDLNDVYFSGMPWASFLSLMSPMTKVFSLLGLRLQPFMSDWTEGWISRYMRTHTSTNKSLISRDWLDQLTTHAYTAAPDIVLCGNKVLLTRHQIVSQKSSFSTRWTWRDYEQCLRIEDDPWRLSWVFPTLRRRQQQAKVDSSLHHSFNEAS